MRITQIVAIVFTVILLVLGFGAGTSHAWEKAEDIAACERSNVINGCGVVVGASSCDCRTTNTMCKREKGQTAGTCVAVRLNPDEDGTFSLKIFPNITGGILILENGEVQVGPTVTNLFKWLFWILALIAVLYGFYGAFKYTTARDDDDAVKEGSGILRNALIGFVIALAAILIVTLVSTLLGFEANDETVIQNNIDNTRDANPADRNQIEPDGGAEDIFNNIKSN